MGIVTLSPARICLGNGGDTDYYLKEIGWGCIVNASLSSLFFQCEIKDYPERAVIYHDLFHETQEINLVPHLRLDDGKLDLIKATISYLHPNFHGALEITTNIPKESGLGGSSTLSVAIAHALLKEKGEPTNPEELARIAYYVERKILQIEGGYQDQWAAAYGRGLNLMIFKNKRVEVTPLTISRDNLKRLEENSLLVYFPKKANSGNEIHGDQRKKLEEDKETMRGIMIEKRTNTLSIKNALEKGDFETFAQLLNKDWELKQKLSDKLEVRDDIFTTALQHGAIGGRLCGAGIGGAYYFYCKEGKKQQVLDAIKEKIHLQLPFRIQRPDEQGNQYVIRK